MKLIFTYGTLMQGNRNHGFMAGSEFLCEAKLRDYAIYDLGWFPAIKAEQGAIVTGEIYRVPEEEMAPIRMLECEGRLYKETPVCCEVEGEPVLCLAYVYLPEVSEEQRINGSQLWRRK